MENKANITFKVINVDEVILPQLKKKNKKDKGPYFKKLRLIYEAGFKKYDFKKSCLYKNDNILLMYLQDRIIGYVFMHINGGRETNNITNPFFYNFVVDPKLQNEGYGSTMLGHLKKLYKNIAIYCLCETGEDAKDLHTWYDKRGGSVFNGYNQEINDSMTWPEKYIVYIFDPAEKGSCEDCSYNANYCACNADADEDEVLSEDQLALQKIMFAE